MSDLPSVTGIVAEVRERFGDRLTAVRVSRRDEIYFDAKMDLVAGFSAHLYKIWDARLVGIFADDVRAQENVFHLYYVYALDAAHAFFILRVPLPPDKPEFPSLANAIPAADVQEREIQDLFGLKLIGHPNPRR
jgi:Ni,Fe-hydrogenase III component G